MHFSLLWTKLNKIYSYRQIHKEGYNKNILFLPTFETRWNDHHIGHIFLCRKLHQEESFPPNLCGAWASGCSQHLRACLRSYLLQTWRGKRWKCCIILWFCQKIIFEINPVSFNQAIGSNVKRFNCRSNIKVLTSAYIYLWLPWQINSHQFLAKCLLEETVGCAETLVETSLKDDFAFWFNCSDLGYGWSIARICCVFHICNFRICHKTNTNAK